MNQDGTTLLSAREARILSALREVAAEDASSGDQLWSKLTTTVVRRNARRKARLLGAVVLALLVLGLLSTTVVLAGGNIAQRFGMLLLSAAAVERLSAPTPTPVAGAVQPWASSAANAVPVSDTLEETQRRLAFQLRVPTWLPDGVIFRGAMAQLDGQGGGVAYRREDSSSGGFGLQMSRGHQDGGYAVPGSATQQVQVHGLAAVYAQGSWNERGQWQSDADAGLLSWEQDGFTFVLTHSGLHLTLADVLRIAESVR